MLIWTTETKRPTQNCSTIRTVRNQQAYEELCNDLDYSDQTYAELYADLDCRHRTGHRRLINRCGLQIANRLTRSVTLYLTAGNEQTHIELCTGQERRRTRSCTPIWSSKSEQASEDLFADMDCKWRTSRRGTECQSGLQSANRCIGECALIWTA